MDPGYVRDGPGKSPMGMDLVPECPGASTGGAPGTVVIDAATVQNIGVRTLQVDRRDLFRSVRAVGRVAYDERRVAHVHTKVQGWVERLLVTHVGQRVERGQPLLEIYSPELVATQEELLLAGRYRDTTRDSPFADVHGGGESLFEATRRRLALWDIPQRDIERLLRTGEVKRTLTLYAPASGVVTELGVRSGMQVRPHANLYTIADLSKVWVLADVYEFELPWLELGREATVELRSLPGESMRGELTYIAPFLDPKTRTAQVRLELDNAAGKLKPEMFGNAVIAGTPRADVLAVPSDAVIRSGTRTLAVVSLGQGRFEPRDLELGLDNGQGWLEVRAGLREGERVVVSSQFLIDSESNLQEAVQKLLAPPAHESPGAPRAPSGHAGHAGHEMPGEAGSGTEPAPAPEPDHATMDHSAHTDHSANTGHSAPDPPAAPSEAEAPAGPPTHAGHAEAPDAHHHAGHAGTPDAHDSMPMVEE
ncbi:MAG: efflux RND transporter periplasmic adaptor subunit [Proteobacteria bacterium]|nr:efflux RND transporter periplasmic adaptor subunit [Pseudomonadota bacterium]